MDQRAHPDTKAGVLTERRSDRTSTEKLHAIAGRRTTLREYLVEQLSDENVDTHISIDRLLGDRRRNAQPEGPIPSSQTLIDRYVRAHPEFGFISFPNLASLRNFAAVPSEEPSLSIGLIRPADHIGNHYQAVSIYKERGRVCILAFESVNANAIQTATAITTYSELLKSVPKSCGAMIELDIQRSPWDCGAFSLAFAHRIAQCAPGIQQLSRNRIGGYAIDAAATNVRRFDVAPASLSSRILDQLARIPLIRRLPVLRRFERARRTFDVVAGDGFLPAPFFEHIQSKSRLHSLLACRPDFAIAPMNGRGETLPERFQRYLVERNSKKYSASIEHLRVEVLASASGWRERFLPFKSVGRLGKIAVLDEVVAFHPETSPERPLFIPVDDLISGATVFKEGARYPLDAAELAAHDQQEARLTVTGGKISISFFEPTLDVRPEEPKRQFHAPPSITKLDLIARGKTIVATAASAHRRERAAQLADQPTRPLAAIAADPSLQITKPLGAQPRTPTIDKTTLSSQTTRPLSAVPKAGASTRRR